MPTRTRQDYLAEADRIVRKNTYSHEDAARVKDLVVLADRAAPADGHHPEDPELQSWVSSIRKLRPGEHRSIEWPPAEQRDMGIATGGGGGYLVPAGFRDELAAAMRQYDQLFDRDVITWFEMDRGGPVTLPSFDDTTTSAVIVAEGVQGSEADPTVGAVQLGNASTWRSGKIAVSLELLQDSGFPIADLLSAAFAVRFARGLGASLASTLLSGAGLGATAAGDPNKAGATAANSIGYADLSALRLSLDPAYRASAKCFWALNDNTLAAIDNLLDKQGHPLVHPKFDLDGRRLLLGYKVALCPSLPDIGASQKPIAFGALNFLILRSVPQATKVSPYLEAPGYAENGLVGFQGFFRANAGLLNAGSNTPPVVYLQNGS